MSVVLYSTLITLKNHWKTILELKGVFTPDANEALSVGDLHVKSMQRRDRQSCGAIRANEAVRMTRRELSVWGVWHELKNLNFGGYSCRVNQSGACSSSDVITSRGRKSEKTMEDKLIVVICGYPELYDTTSYFYKNRNKNDLAWKKVSEEVGQSVANFTCEWSKQTQNVQVSNYAQIACDVTRTEAPPTIVDWQ